MQTVAGHRSLVRVTQSSLVVSDHRQTAAYSVGEIITIVQLYPFFGPSSPSLVCQLSRWGRVLEEPENRGLILVVWGDVLHYSV